MLFSRSWTLRAPSEPGNYELYLAIQHGTPDGGVAMTGISSAKQVTVSEVPENLPRLSEGWEPVNSRLIGEETVITLETENTDSATVEIKIGGEISTLPLVDNQFTIPAAVNPGVVEWRVTLEGEGPTQTSPWFRITAQEPGWEIDESALYIQGFAMFVFCVSVVLLIRPNNRKPAENKYDNTQEVVSQIAASEYNYTETPEQNYGTPPLPVGGLPAGWTMEQWEYYGHEYLSETSGGVQ